MQDLRYRQASAGCGGCSIKNQILVDFHLSFLPTHRASAPKMGFFGGRGLCAGAQPPLPPFPRSGIGTRQTIYPVGQGLCGPHGRAPLPVGPRGQAIHDILGVEKVSITCL